MPTSFDTIARIAGRQHGRISHAQLVAAGVGRDRIKRWRAGGLLRRAHVGVYAFGHAAPSPRADLMAAVLACGSGAVVSHASAAHAFGIRPAPPAWPEVTVPTTAGRCRPRIVVHRVRAIDPRDVTVRAGVPTTIVARVLLDLSPRLAPAALTRACHEAWVRYGTTPAHIQACIARNPTKKGAPKLLRALGADVTLSALEDGFLALLNRAALPRPRTNVDRHGDKVDCHWPAQGLTVELLGYRFHASREAFEADIARRRRSSHIAYTYGDVFERGARTATEIATLLRSPDRTSGHVPAPAIKSAGCAPGTGSR
jgi:hypothetical protein